VSSSLKHLWNFICLTISSDARAQCYKTFYSCNFLMFGISWSVCPLAGLYSLV
jgi:hypothetical protein